MPSSFQVHLLGVWIVETTFAQLAMKADHPAFIIAYLRGRNVLKLALFIDYHLTTHRKEQPSLNKPTTYGTSKTIVKAQHKLRHLLNIVVSNWLDVTLQGSQGGLRRQRIRGLHLHVRGLCSQ